jgi:hypothetical protein
METRSVVRYYVECVREWGDIKSVDTAKFCALLFRNRNFEIVFPAFLFFLEYSGIKSTTGLFHQTWMKMDDDERGAVGGMFVRRNLNTRRKPAPVQLYPPQIPHILKRARTRASAVESRRLSA